MGIFKKKNKVFSKTNIDFSDENIASTHLKDNDETARLQQNQEFDATQQLNSVGFNDFTNRDITSETNSLTIDFTKRHNLVSIQEDEPFLLVDYNQVQTAADSLLENKFVRIDLSSIDNSAERKRIVDFLSGITYAFKGTVEVIGARSYCFKIEE